jgi:HAD superfamily hydrolase (TIGR01509 family)
VNGIIFDLDGVLVDSMPLHYKGWKTAFEEIASLHVDERSVYLLEGMRGIDLVKEIFKKYNYLDVSKAQIVTKMKDEVFRSEMKMKVDAYDKVDKILQELSCIKGIVSGAAKEDVVSIISNSFRDVDFDIVLTGDDIKKGKPEPEGFNLFVNRMKLNPSNVLVVENAPLGVEAAKRAGIEAVVVLNNSPLQAEDFTNLIEPNYIYSETKNLEARLIDWCKHEKVNEPFNVRS